MICESIPYTSLNQCDDPARAMREFTVSSWYHGWVLGGQLFRGTSMVLTYSQQVIEVSPLYLAVSISKTIVLTLP